MIQIGSVPLIQTGIVRGACPHDCPDTCAMLVHVRDGRAVRVQGDPAHPVTVRLGRWVIIDECRCSQPLAKR